MRWFAERLLNRLGDCGIEATPEAFAQQLSANTEAYKPSVEGTLRELPGVEIWNDWFLRDYHIGRERLAPIAEELLDVTELGLWLYNLLSDYPAERVALNAATRLWRAKAHAKPCGLLRIAAPSSAPTPSLKRKSPAGCARRVWRTASTR